MAGVFPGVSICCYCSICLEFFQRRISQCSLCLGTPKKNQGHNQKCGLSKVSSYFMRYHKEPASRGQWYCLISHGSSEEEARMTIQGDKLPCRKLASLALGVSSPWVRHVSEIPQKRRPWQVTTRQLGSLVEKLPK